MTEEEATLVELLSSSKRRRFVLNYVDNGGNATKAAVSAGYAEKSAHVEGSRLLKDDKVRAAIRKYSQAKANVAGENRDTILDRMINRAQLDIREYYVTVPIVDTEGNQRIARDGLPLVTEEMKPLNQLTRAQASRIKKLKFTQQGPELEFHCPAQADRDLANLLGYAKEDHSSLTAEDAAALIAASLAKMDELDHSSTAH
jgi:phage terminase small subunit